MQRRTQQTVDSPYGWRPAVVTVCFGAFMSQLDASIVTLTYPSLRREFHAPLAAVEWVSLAYLLVLAAVMVAVGHLSDMLGRKRVYLWGFVLFAVSSAACSLAPGLGALIGFRAVQALAASMLASNSLALVYIVAPPEKLRGALGMQAAGQALGLALGPTLGGVLVTTAGWRSVFWINVPVGIAAHVVGRFLLPESTGTADARHFDLAGTGWLAASVATLLGGLSMLSGLPVPGWAGALLLAASAVLARCFLRCEQAAREPLVPPALLRDPRIVWGLLGAWAGNLVLFGPLVLVPLTLTDRGETELRAGLLLTALPAGFALAANLQDALLPRRWSSRLRCATGGLLALVVLAGAAAYCPEDVWLVLWLALLGAGLGVFTPANNAMTMSRVPRELAATGGGLLNTSRSIGVSLGIAVITLTLHIGSARTAHSLLPLFPVLALAAVTLLLGASAYLGSAHRGTGPAASR